ncbi:MAG: transposase [Candidatus Omnitrophica bacterium]|nr:transposase [Candidatus Omnitrophota bacterium]
MRKTFKYRIYPNKTQTKSLESSLDACRWLYNNFLEQRKNTWETEKKSLSRFDQSKTIPILKQEYPFLNNAFSQCLQDVSTRIDLAFRAFFRRVKAGEKPGYPRYRGEFRYDSFTYPQAGFKLLENIIQLSKIGGVKIKLHRPIEGTIKTCTIRRTPTGKWFITFVCDVEHTSTERSIEPAIGIDMGLTSFATLSNGEHIENPRFFRQEEKNLVKAQRKLSIQKKGTKERKKARKVVARVYERINWKRENFAHQESRKLVNRFNTIVVEDLSINDMTRNNFRGINKSIGDAAWRQFLNLLSFKAAWAGKKYVGVNPAFTSQNCSACGNRHKLNLSDRIYHCPVCSLSLDRDENAAINILSLGLKTLGSSLEAVCFS